MAQRDYYDVLGIDRQASIDQVKEAYRKLALKYHPDRNPDDKSATEKFREATEAYEVLSDPQKKDVYDKHGFQGLRGGGFDPSDDLGRVYRDFGGRGDVFGSYSFEDLFDLFGMGGGRRSRRSAYRGEDIESSVSITLDEAYRGVKKEVVITRLDACPECSGSGAAAGSGRVACPQCGGSGQVRFNQGFFSIAQSCNRCGGSGQVIEKPCRNCNARGRVRRKSKLEISIPAGIDSGSHLRVRGKGNSAPGGGSPGGSPGDLFLNVMVEPHPLFERHGQDIHLDRHITFTEAARGTEKEVPTLNGRVKMKVPAGTQSGRVFRLRGKGMPRVGSSGYGDQLVRVRVETPVNLGREERRLLDALEKNTGARSYPKSKGKS